MGYPASLKLKRIVAHPDPVSWWNPHNAAFVQTGSPQFCLLVKLYNLYNPYYLVWHIYIIYHKPNSCSNYKPT